MMPSRKMLVNGRTWNYFTAADFTADVQFLSEKFAIDV